MATGGIQSFGAFKVSDGSILSGARRTRSTAFRNPQPAPGIVEGCDSGWLAS
jgi:hypothetical protein